MGKITQVIKRSGALVPYNPDRITNAIYRAFVANGERDHQVAQNLSDVVVQLLDESFSTANIPTVEEIQDLVEEVLIKEGHVEVARSYILYRDERKRSREGRKALASHSSANIPWKKIWYTLNWAVEHGIHTVSGLNDCIKRGKFSHIVKISEEIYHQDVENAVEMIADRRDDIRLVIITGPSSSGKTTTTIKVSQRLEEMGLKLVTLIVDNYFLDLDMHPKDEFGDYDYETPHALDLPLINEHLTKLLAGKEVRVPFYDFKTGQRGDSQTPLKLKKNEIVLIDSLHGLYGDMTRGIPHELQFRLYLEPLLQLKLNDGKYVRWTDIRLIRRMLRDEVHRNWPMERTLTHWHYVRSSEMRNIIPFVNTTDYIINSGMPYELPLYRPKLLDQFAEWVKKYKDDPLRRDAYNRAERVHQMLKQVVGVEDDSAVPGNSVLREFIGGSIYEH
jgi:uridine kinase